MQLNVLLNVRKYIVFSYFFYLLCQYILKSLFHVWCHLWCRIDPVLNHISIKCCIKSVEDI